MAITFEDFDKFDRKPFAERLTKGISALYSFRDDAFVLSLNASFGSGKTTFLQMWQHYLESEGYKVIYINAWKTDFDDEPFIHIASALLDNIKTGEGAIKAKNALKGALGVSALIGNKLLEQVSGINTAEVMKDLESDKNSSNLQKIGDEIYKEFSFKKKIYEELKAKLTEYINNLPKPPLVFFVDELDRTRPDYAVKFLEAIKHIFPIKGACFVLAVDRKQLEASVKQLYGDIDFENYYRRFISREANLPEASTLELEKFISQLEKEYFYRMSEQGVQFPFSGNQKSEVMQCAKIICRTFKFTPRQMESLFRIYSQFLAVDKDVKNSIGSWLKAALILIAFYVHKPDLYHKIGQGTISPKELFDFINSPYFSGHNADRDKKQLVWISMAFNLNDNEKNKEETLKVSGTYLKLSNDINTLAKSVYNGSDLEEKSAFQQLYKTLEEWRSFIE